MIQKCTNQSGTKSWCSASKPSATMCCTTTKNCSRLALASMWMACHMRACSANFWRALLLERIKVARPSACWDGASNLAKIAIFHQVPSTTPTHAMADLTNFSQLTHVFQNLEQTGLTNVPALILIWKRFLHSILLLSCPRPPAGMMLSCSANAIHVTSPSTANGSAMMPCFPHASMST